MSKKNDMPANMTTEQIEELALKAAANHGVPDTIFVPDPDTGEYLRIHLKNPTPEGMILLKRIRDGL